MNLTLEHIERIKRLHKLLLNKHTRPPKECAQKLKISDRTLREDLQIILFEN
jgi:transcriptional antiterminator